MQTEQVYEGKLGGIGHLVKADPFSLLYLMPSTEISYIKCTSKKISSFVETKKI
jgi:hypothetical protein